MEEVLVEETFKGLSAIQGLSSGLTATAQTQRVLAHKVGPHLAAAAAFRRPLVRGSISSLRWRP